jgi:hypothetical protein
MDLSHRVVAAVAGTPKRVECQTCHTQHNYREPKGTVKAALANGKSKSKSAARPAGKAVKPARAAKHQHEWEALIAGKSGSGFRTYSVQASFEPEELIRHKTFGEGCVLEVLQDQKINVMFREGCKVLVHGRS